MRYEIRVMRILHIIPTAFNYFDTIKGFAFQIVELQNDLGVYADAITLQYSAKDAGREKSKNLRDFAKAREDIKLGKKPKIPPLKYQGVQALHKSVSNFSDYDIIHLHAPFLGAGSEIFNWKRRNPEKKLVVSYYNGLDNEDLFGFFIKLYNAYYLPKLFRLADLVIGIDGSGFMKTPASRYLKDYKKLVFMIDSSVDESGLTLNENEVKLDNQRLKQIVQSMLASYLELLKQQINI